MTSWRRNINTQNALTSGYYWNDAISAGDTYMRVHIRWGFFFATPVTIDVQAVSQNVVTFGLLTDVGNGSEIPPSPRSGSDPDPPLSRWIYWETRAPVVQGVDNAAGVIYWGDSPTGELTQTKGQVNASSLPSGDTLNLFASWQSATDWSAFDVTETSIWHAISILRKF